MEDLGKFVLLLVRVQGAKMVVKDSWYAMIRRVLAENGEVITFANDIESSVH